MRPWVHFLLCLLVLVPVISHAGTVDGEEADKVVRIGVLAKRGPEKCLEKWSPTADYLTGKIPGHRFSVIPLEFEEVFIASENQDVDLVLANSAFYVQLELQYGAKRLVTLKNQLADQAFTTFGGVIFCRADRSDITTLLDLRGKTFAAVKATSFGGWHAALRELKAHNINPESDFATLDFSGTHDAVVRDVLNGKVDAGTVRTDTLERMALEGLIDLDDIKAIPATPKISSHFPFLLSTRLYPEWPVAALRHTSPNLAEAVASALLAMPDDHRAAEVARISGWTVPLNYQPVHDCARELGIGYYAHTGDISFGQYVLKHWPWFAACLAAFLAILSVATAFANKNRVLLDVRGHLQSELVERRKAQAALQQSESMYRGVVERAADAIYLFDCDGLFYEANEAVTDHTGFTQDEVIGHHFLGSFEADDRARAQEAFETCLEGESVEFDSLIRRKHRSSAWFSIGIQPIFDVSGKVVGIQGISHDISERKRSEARKHREGEAYLKTILESTADAILAVGIDNRVMHANTRFVEMWEIPPNVLSVGDAAPLYEIMIAQLVDPDALLACIQDPHVNQDEQHGLLVFKDGRIFERFSCPLVVDDVIEGRVCSYRDITARRKGEQERELLLSAIEQAAEMVVITDAAGITEYVNPAYESVTGYSKDEAIGRNPRILDCDCHDRSFFSELWATINSGKTWRGRICNQCKDQTEFTEDAVISPVRDLDGVIAHFVIVKRDVSHEIELEDGLRQAQKMEAVGQLAGGIAHDFNNLLQVIDGHVDLLLMTLEPEDPSRQDIETVRDAADRAANLTRQLLAFSRQQWIQPVDLDLNQLVADLMKLLRRVIGEHVSLRIIPAPGIGIIRADPGQIEQVLVNLCINARDAMPDGGNLTIETENLVFTGDSPDGFPEAKAGAYVCLSVTDSGSGIDAETLERIFEPFFTTKEAGQGTGLGLSTVYGIIKQHEGIIHVESEPGIGSTFRAFLPVVESEKIEEIDDVEVPAAAGQGHETILVAEDEERVCKLAERILKQNGYRVFIASDGEEAVRVFEEHSHEIDLALLDIVMPKMGGRDVMKKLRQQRPDLLILFTTGYSQQTANVDFVLETGVQLLKKPYHTGEFLARIREILDS